MARVQHCWSSAEVLLILCVFWTRDDPASGMRYNVLPYVPPFFSSFFPFSRSLSLFCSYYFFPFSPPSLSLPLSLSLSLSLSLRERHVLEPFRRLRHVMCEEVPRTVRAYAFFSCARSPSLPLLFSTFIASVIPSQAPYVRMRSLTHRKHS